jgi:DNA helicase HerA-like ATPase
MGWKLNALAFLFALWALDNGDLVIGIPIMLYLFYRFWSNRQSGPPGTGRSHWTIYLGAFLLFLSLVAVAEQGTYSPVVFGASGITLLALGIFPGLVQDVSERVSGPASELFAEMSGRKRDKEEPVTCVELTQLPLDYLDKEKNDPKETLQKFRRLTQTLAELGAPVEMRLEFSEGSGKVVFSANGGQKLQGLLPVLKSQLPEFGAQTTERLEKEDAASIQVEGVPEPSADPITPLAKFFVESRLDGCYGVKISPAWVNPVSRWLAGRRQRKIAEGSGYQHVDDDRTTTVVDHPKQVELEDSVKTLERLLARRPVRVSVQVSAQDEVTALHAANVLAGSLSSHRRINGLRVGRPQRGGRSGWRRSTTMLPSEAAPYFWLPQVSLGMKVAPSAEFQAPPASEGEVVLGEVVNLSGKSGRQVRVGRDQLAKHVFVTGMTGSGKTTSCFSLLLQLHRMGVPFLVIEPVKSEYRSLMGVVPELQVFTVGDDGTAPFRLNIFEPPPGVKVQSHLESLVVVWNSSFVSYAPTPYVVEQVFAEVYRECGWDLARNTRGRPVTFDDVEAQVQRVVRGLGYEPRVTMDIEAAIMVRLKSLRTGRKAQLFDVPSSTPIEPLLERPTVVELEDIQKDEEKAFVASLLLTNLAACVQSKGWSKKLRHFTLIEEAHRLLPNISTERGNPEAADARRVLVEQFGNMLAELRAYGEGLAVVEQIPTKILPDAIKNTATKVVHRLPDAKETEVMAGAMNATEEQGAVLTALKPGEAVVRVEGHPVPVRVEVDDVVSRMAIPVGQVDDWAVKRRMAEFYLKNPLPKEHQDARDSRVRKLVEEEQFRKEFIRTYRVWLKSGDVAPLREFVIQSAQGLAMGPSEVLVLASGVLRLATAYYLPFDAERRVTFPRVFMKEVEAAYRG